MREVGRVGGYLLRRVAKLCGRIGIAHDGSQIVADIGAALPRRGRNPHFQRRGPEYDRVVGDRLVHRTVVPHADVLAARAALVAQHGGRCRDAEGCIRRHELFEPGEAMGAVGHGDILAVVPVVGERLRLVVVRAYEVLPVALVEHGSAGRFLDDRRPPVACRGHEQRFADEGVAAAGDLQRLCDGRRMLQDLACEDRDGCRRCERHGPFRGIDRHG